MTPKPPSLSVLAYRINLSMALDREVVVTLRTRPARTVRGRVTRKRIDKAKKIDPKRRDRSNLIVTIGGEEFEVERMSDVRVMPS